LKKSIDMPHVIACKQGIPCRQGRYRGVNINSKVPAETSGTSLYKRKVFRKRVRKAIMNGVKWRE